MKRLKRYLNVRETNVTYKEIYDGKIHMIPRDGEPYNIAEPIYWHNDISYEITRSNRIELSKPTVRIGIPIKLLKIAVGLVDDTTKLSHHGIPAADYCLRSFVPYVTALNEENYNRKRTDVENGKFYVHEPNGKVVKRNCSYFKKQSPKYYNNGTGNVVFESQKVPEFEWYLNIVIMIQLPEKNNKKASDMMIKQLPDVVKRYIDNFNLNELKQAVGLYNKQEQIREWLKTSDFCAFIADGSILPRENSTDLPMKQAVPFSCCHCQRIEFGQFTGMGIRRGVTVITGGGYSGKSTMLDAISDGIYNHKIGDGREYVITDDSAMKISAEDGRSVKNVNISPFIRWLPKGSTKNFSTEHASGSTSQAANIIEAVESGSNLLLIDEDKSATNFMIRDLYMQELVKNEPIVPFTDRVQELYQQLGVSTILVIGGSSEYLRVSDSVLLMEGYQPNDVTQYARDMVASQTSRLMVPKAVWEWKRLLNTQHFTSYPENQTTEHMLVSLRGFLEIGDECVDVHMIHNIIDYPQLVAIAYIIRKLMISKEDRTISIHEKVEELLHSLEITELDSIYTGFFPKCDRWLTLPRKYEILAVIYRMRRIQFHLEES